MRSLFWIVVVAAALFAFALPREATRPVAAQRTATPTPILLPAAQPSATAAAAPAMVAGETVLLRQPDGHFYANAEVNYGQVRFMVDTGATPVALSQADAMRANVAFDPGRFEVVGSGASGPVYGQAVTIHAITLDGKRAQGVPGVVLRDVPVSLLGQSYLRQLRGVAIEGDRMTLR